MFLADRIIVLGKNPGRIRTDFHVELAAAARSQGALVSSHTVDYIYRVLTQPESEPDKRPTVPRDQTASVQVPDAPACAARRHRRSARDPAGPRTATTISTNLRTISGSRSTTCCRLSKRGHARLRHGERRRRGDDANGRQFRQADILRRKVLFRDAALQHVALIDRSAARSMPSPTIRVPDEFFRDFLDEHFSEEESEATRDGDQLGPLSGAVRSRCGAEALLPARTEHAKTAEESDGMRLSFPLLAQSFDANRTEFRHRSGGLRLIFAVLLWHCRRWRITGRAHRAAVKISLSPGLSRFIPSSRWSGCSPHIC